MNESLQSQKDRSLCDISTFFPAILDTMFLATLDQAWYRVQESERTPIRGAITPEAYSCHG